MAKCLEIRITFPDGEVTDEVLNNLGEEFQIKMPVDFEQEGLTIIDVTYEVKDVTL